MIAEVRKIHENMGHCSKENLVMILKYGRARQAFIEAAKQLVCDACEETQRPKLARPSTPQHLRVQPRHWLGHVLHLGSTR